MKIQSYLNAALGVLFPSLCVSCGLILDDRNGTICASCLARVPLFGHRSCPICGKRVPADRHGVSVGTSPCHSEARHILIAATSYASPEAQALVKALKYDGIRRAAETMALLAAAAAYNTFEEIFLTRKDWIMVPVPLHAKRERKRGFNQSALFTAALARHEPFRGVPIAPALWRMRHTETQTERPNYAARQENVTNCFVVPDPATVRGKNILLIDDVATSGATLHEAARVFKAAGAARIAALVFAKA